MRPLKSGLLRVRQLLGLLGQLPQLQQERLVIAVLRGVPRGGKVYHMPSSALSATWRDGWRFAR